MILADPPWHYSNAAARGALSYPTMTTREIADLPVATVARASGCVLALWVTGAHLLDGLKVMRAWGFEQKQVGVWVKTTEDGGRVRMGVGNYFRNAAEPWLLGVRGRPEIRDRGLSNVILAPRREHSRKPDDLHARLERLTPGPYLEIFARRPRPGWASWGNEGVEW